MPVPPPNTPLRVMKPDGDPSPTHLPIERGGVESHTHSTAAKSNFTTQTGAINTIASIVHKLEVLDTNDIEALCTLSPQNSDDRSKAERLAEPDNNQPQTLDVDLHDSDDDQADGISAQSSFASGCSRFMEPVEENGRTYHKYKYGHYFFPNDEVEQERLDLQHHLFKLTLDGKLSLAPVSNPCVVLDIGTGTGIWAVEYALQNPSARVIGTDLSPIQPQFVPPNCQFEVHDCEDEWIFEEKFDYIHGRAIFSGLKDPATMFKSAYGALAPGGWFEMQDIYFKPHSIDGTHQGTALQSWNNTLIEGAKKVGRDWWCTPNYEQWFREAGFEEVVVRQYLWPANTWPRDKKNKTLGLWTLANGLDGLSAVSLAMMSRVLGMSPEAVEVVLVDVRRDMKDKSLHIYYPIYVVYGCKPF